ncbi:MAG TPA: hypothetical protein PL187_16940 [Caldilinea sp.]|nr:hypothetical protein [Caldilinea sp.]
MTPDDQQSPVRVQPAGWAARLQELKHRQTEDRLRRCDEMLTAAGVPEWVMNSENGSVPANSTPARLRWYLARRKDIKPGEIDQQLQREMKEWLNYVAQHNDLRERPAHGDSRQPKTL